MPKYCPVKWVQYKHIGNSLVLKANASRSNILRCSQPRCSTNSSNWFKRVEPFSFLVQWSNSTPWKDHLYNIQHGMRHFVDQQMWNCVCFVLEYINNSTDLCYSFQTNFKVATSSQIKSWLIVELTKKPSGHFFFHLKKNNVV